MPFKKKKKLVDATQDDDVRDRENKLKGENCWEGTQHSHRSLY